MELDVCAADLDARVALGRALGIVEAKRRVVLGRLLGVDRLERDVVEVVLDVRRRLDEPYSHALAELDLDTVGKARARTIEIRHAQRDVLERTLARAGPRP